MSDIRELASEEAVRMLKERMMFPSADELTAWGYTSRQESSVARLRRLRSELRDNMAIEDYLLTQHEMAQSVPNMAVNKLVADLNIQVLTYKSQERDRQFKLDLERRDIRLFPNLYPLFKRQQIDEDKLPLPRQLQNLADTPVAFKDLAWSPSIHFQSIGRLRRRMLVNVIQLPGRYASRNKREGHYNFKIDGRHTRKHRPPKIVVLTIEDGSQLARLRDKVSRLTKEKFKEALK